MKRITDSATLSQQTLIPAAQYVRMSDDHQQYSIDNQKAAIQEYATRHGFRIVRTYTDAGKSGVIAKHRTALRELLKDVITGNVDYKAILVYDVSRWGRFQDTDEAAHYEFLCSNAGVPLHYCAEQFANDGAVSSSLLKALKRSMAAEFSRELSDKVFRGKSRLAEMGYWVGGQAGYGYQRLMISADGKPKQLMRFGEQKSFTTDRVILVPGSKEQVECVKFMFSMVMEGYGCTAIARELNRRGTTFNGREWRHQDVFNVVTHRKYTGCNVWYRSTQYLHSRERPVEARNWITKPGAFKGIVNQETFDRAQAMLPRHADSLWSDQDILKKLRRLLAAKGRLSETLILKRKGMPSLNTLAKHFGSYRRAYEAAGYKPTDQETFRIEQCERAVGLRQMLVTRIQGLFPYNVAITHLPKRSRSMLQIDDKFVVAILMCRQKRRNGGKLHWVVEPKPIERDNITLLCKMNPHNGRIGSYYLFPHMDTFRAHRSFNNDPWLRTGTKLASLSEFYEAAVRTWGSRRKQPLPDSSSDLCSVA
jgi:DNA invertase Pin-like site-specific DNA recombinase